MFSTLVVGDLRSARLSIWGFDGEHAVDRYLGMDRMISGPMFGGENGSTIAHYLVRRSGSSMLQIVAKVSSDGEELWRFGEFRVPPMLFLQTGPDSGWKTADDISGSPQYVATATGSAYLTAGDEYQIVALDQQGQPRWALRVAWERFPVTKDDIQERISRIPEALSHLDFDVDGTEWPEAFGSISRLSLDGHGRLYVFPHVSASGRSADGFVPVDVFSPDGEHLFSGLIEPFEWTAAKGDHVYGIRENQETGEREPVRYSLAVPF